MAHILREERRYHLRVIKLKIGRKKTNKDYVFIIFILVLGLLIALDQN